MHQVSILPNYHTNSHHVRRPVSAKKGRASPSDTTRMASGTAYQGCVDAKGADYFAAGQAMPGMCYQHRPQSAAPAFFGYMGCACALIL